MRAGGINSIAVMRGQEPHLRQRALLSSMASQSSSVSTSAWAIADQPYIRALTLPAQLSDLPRYAVRSLTTSPMGARPKDAPRRRPAPCNDHNAHRRNRSAVVLRGCNVRERTNVGYVHASLLHSRRLTSAPLSGLRGSKAGRGFNAPAGLHDFSQKLGCRRASECGLAPEAFGLLRPLEPGRDAPAGSRYRMFDCHSYAGVQYLHDRPRLRAPLRQRQAHQ